MQRREFLTAVGSAVALSQVGCLASAPPSGSRTLRRVGVQLYSLRADARADLERTIANIAQAGYNDVELLGSMNNFGMAPATLRQLLDRNGLRAPSTHVAAAALDDLQRNLDDAQTLGHGYLTIASLPLPAERTLDDYRRWADRMNEAGRVARGRGIWLAFHDHPNDHDLIEGKVAYDVFVERTDPAAVRHQLDTGNAAMAGRDPLEFMDRFGDRYWMFHIKDVPSMGAKEDTELGKGVIDFRRLLARIDRIDEKHLFVEQETYPGTPLDSVKRDYAYISTLKF